MTQANDLRSSVIAPGANMGVFTEVSERTQPFNAFMGHVSHTPDSKRWADAISPILDRSLTYAEYAEPSCRGYVAFFENILAPSMGAFPSRGKSSQKWRSFMTDDFTPTELSYSFDGRHRSLRLSTEAISLHAGTDKDPFNVARSDELLHELVKTLPNVDSRWYDILRKTIVVDDLKVDRASKKDILTTAPSQIFFGFDFERDSIGLKVYFLPTMKACELQQSRLDLVSNILPMLETNGLVLRPGFSLIESHLRSFSGEVRPKVEIVSIDCQDPLQSRLKIYVRNRQTSFRSVCDMFTLGGRLTDPFLTTAMACLRTLWQLVLDLPENFDEDKPLTPNSTFSIGHRTGGILYYYAIRAGKAQPSPKVYIPVRHYAKNDRQIAEGLAKMFLLRGWTSLAKTYVEAVEMTHTHRPLDKRTGLHTYVCFSIKRGNVTIEPYQNPEVYSQAMRAVDVTSDTKAETLREGKKQVLVYS